MRRQLLTLQLFCTLTTGGLNDAWSFFWESFPLPSGMRQQNSYSAAAITWECGLSSTGHKAINSPSPAIPANCSRYLVLVGN
jgi:hypothetical protein